MTDERRYELDWLRALALGAVFLFHCGMLFNHSDGASKTTNSARSFTCSTCL